MARTTTSVHTPEMRRKARENAGKRQRLALIRMLAAAVMIRHACMIVPEAGAAGWWLTALCTLPGLACYGLLRIFLRLMRAGSIPELVQRASGVAAVRLVNAVPAAALAAEGAASLTALTAVFTDGVITTVGAWMFALAAAAVLCLCTGRDGLLNGASLLRWALGVFMVAILINMIPHFRSDHLFPMGGDGTMALRSVFASRWGMAWPVVLLLWEEPPEDGRRRALIPPAIAAAAALAFCLTLPHETLTLPRTLAGRMLLPGATLLPVSRMLLMCLWTGGLALSSLIASVRAADLLLPCAFIARWMPPALLVLFALLQLPDGDVLHEVVFTIEAWLLVPFAALTVLLAAGCIRRKGG